MEASMGFEQATEEGIVPALEPEVLWARRAFPKAQQLLAGVAHRQVGVRIPACWHEGRAHPERGSFAVVQRGHAYEELLGEILIVTYRRQPPIYVYCVNTADVPQPISLYRRAYIELSRLSRDAIDCKIEVRV